MNREQALTSIAEASWPEGIKYSDAGFSSQNQLFPEKSCCRAYGVCREQSTLPCRGFCKQLRESSFLDSLSFSDIMIDFFTSRWAWEHCSTTSSSTWEVAISSLFEQPGFSTAIQIPLQDAIHSLGDVLRVRSPSIAGLIPGAWGCAMVVSCWPSLDGCLVLQVQIQPIQTAFP